MSCTSNSEMDSGTYADRYALSRLLVDIYTAIDHERLWAAQASSDHGLPSCLTMHFVMADALQYLQLETIGTIVSREAYGYSLQEILGSLMAMIHRFDCDNDTEMIDGSRLPENVRYLRLATETVFKQLQRGNWPMEPIATRSDTTFRNAASVMAESFYQNVTYTQYEPHQVSPAPLTPAVPDTYSNHLSPRARSRVVEWVRDNISPPSSTSGTSSYLSIAAGPTSGGESLNSKSYVFVPNALPYPQDNVSPALASSSNPYGLPPISADRSAAPSPPSVMSIFSLPSYASTHQHSAIGPRSLFDDSCSISPESSASRAWQHPRQPLRQGSISPPVSNCSIAPSESASQTKYRYGLKNNFTWEAHPYRNAPKPGEIVGGARFIDKVGEATFAVFEEVSDPIQRADGVVECEGDFVGFASEELVARLEAPIATNSMMDLDEDSSFVAVANARASPDQPEKLYRSFEERAPDPLRSQVREPTRRSQLAMGIGSIEERSDLSEGERITRALDMIDQQIDLWIAQKNQNAEADLEDGGVR